MRQNASAVQLLFLFRDLLNSRKQNTHEVSKTSLIRVKRLLGTEGGGRKADSRARAYTVSSGLPRVETGRDRRAEERSPDLL